MPLPFFYVNNYSSLQTVLTLDEDTSRHIVQVLRMKPGALLHLTDGKGNLLLCVIDDDNKKHCSVTVQSATYTPPAPKQITIAISLLKNTNRFEWFLEKATELGVHAIIPLLCERTEKEKFRYDRLQQICTSAMLQSQQVYLPELHQPVPFKNIETWKNKNGVNLVAHLVEGQGRQSIRSQNSQSSSLLICIGPEGDFTQAEVELALQHSFIPVSLGNTRLRTETAGVVAASLLCI